MPQLIGLVILGAGLVAGFKALRLVADRFSDELNRTTAESRQTAETAGSQDAVAVKDLGALEFDPISGVYKPRNG